jgi:putative addiction module component (TIGR02574 family)
MGVPLEFFRMSMTREHLGAEALELPVRERAHLAKRLLESLGGDADDDPVAVEQAWAKEIGRRLEDYRAGTMETIPATQVFEQARQRFS